LLSRYLAKEFPGSNHSAIIRQFQEDPNTVTYNGVDFCPLGGKHGCLNLWVGPTLVPVFGAWLNIHYFLFTVICSGKQSIYNYLIRYLAHALQKPQCKPGVMITLLGGQGIGKGTLMKIIMLIWSATTYKTNRIDDVVGQFNAAIEGVLWILLDEAQFSGDAKASTALKSIVTESTISINQKNQAQRMIDSLHRIISATNQEHVGNRESDDRRDLTIRVSDIHKGDHAYWEMLNGCLEQETAAMMHELQNMDISDFNVFKKPDTEELVNQKINSLSPDEAWWLECLHEGTTYGGFGSQWPTFIKTKDIEESIIKYRETSGNRRGLSQHIQAKTLMAKWCKSAAKGRTQDAARHRGYQLPTLSQARQDFEVALGGKVDWED
jgi:hypothetical protein